MADEERPESKEPEQIDWRAKELARVSKEAPPEPIDWREKEAERVEKAD